MSKDTKLSSSVTVAQYQDMVKHNDRIAIYVLRIPGEGIEEYVDRAVESHNAKV